MSKKEPREFREQCGRCGGSGLMWVKIAYRTTDKNGKTVHKTKQDSQLCKACDGRGWHQRYY